MSRPIKPRICLLTETFHPVVGGGESQARALAEGLTGQGYPTLVVTRRSDKTFPPSERLGAVVVQRIGPAGGKSLWKWGLLLSAGPALVRWRKDYDVLFVSGFRILGIPAVIVSRLFGKRCILKSDNLGEMSGEFFRSRLARLRLSTSALPVRLFLWLRNAILHRADAFVAISEAVVEELAAGGIDPEKIWRIPNSVDTERFHPVGPLEKQALRRRLEIPEAACVVIYTGRLVSYKGLPLLLQVWKEIAARHANAYLLMVGPGGLDIDNCEADLRAYVRRERLERSVRFTGRVENVEEFLQAADIFVFPVVNEAFGISLVEAMACGLAVASTTVGGLRDIVRDGQNALAAPPGDAQALQEALERLLVDQALAERLGQAGRASVQERYSSTAVNERYMALFHTVLRQRKSVVPPSRS